MPPKLLSLMLQCSIQAQLSYYNEFKNELRAKWLDPSAIEPTLPAAGCEAECIAEVGEDERVAWEVAPGHHVGAYASLLGTRCGWLSSMQRPPLPVQARCKAFKRRHSNRAHL